MHVYLRGDWQQRIRLLSGLVLFLFAATHFLNHALGLVGLEAMHQAQTLRTAVTRSLPGTVILGLALVAHIALALAKLSRRTTWRIPFWEAAQIGLGLAIPLLLLPHIVNTRIAHTFFEVEDSYLYELVRLWPASAVQQSLLLLLVWVHGCMGLHYWLRLSPLYRSVAPVLLAVAVVLPCAAIAGFVVSGMITADIMTDAGALAELKIRSHWPDAAATATLSDWRTGVRIAFAGLLAAAFGLAIFRVLLMPRTQTGAAVTYTDGPTIVVQPGRTLLESSRDAGILHASVCGGRGRCSTCRIRIEQGLEDLPPATEAETATLRAIDAPANVRLACQLRPTRPLTVSLISAPKTPLPAERGFSEVRDAVAGHVRAKLAGQLSEWHDGDQERVAAWLNQRLGYAVPLPAIADPSIALLGARIDYLGEVSVGVLAFSQGANAISVFVTPISPDGAQMLRAVRNGYHVMGWGQEACRYIAVSDAALGDWITGNVPFVIPPMKGSSDQSDSPGSERNSATRENHVGTSQSTTPATSEGT